MRVVVALDLNDTDICAAYGVNPTETALDWDDLVASIEARLTETFCGPADHPVGGRVVSVGDFTGQYALHDLLDAAEVGVDAIADETDGMDRVAHILGSIATMREHAEAQDA